MAIDRGEALPPPADLASRKITLKPLLPDPALQWHRIGKTRFSPRYFSTDDGWRFSREDMPGVLYLGDSIDTCFWEVFWDDLVNRPVDERRLDMAKVDERSAWECLIPASLQVVDTLDPRVLREIGAHGGTFLGPYKICQMWAKALREHPAKPAGIRYESARNKGNVCLALFQERCESLEWDFGTSVPLRSHLELAKRLAALGRGLPPSIIAPSD
jgi:hypothetical protein